MLSSNSSDNGAMQQSIITMQSLCKFYEMGDQTVRALNSIDLDFRKSDYAAIMGP